MSRERFGLKARYAALGATIGAVLPLADFGLELVVGHDGMLKIAGFEVENPIHVVVLLAPILFAVAFLLVGGTQAKLKRQLDITRAQEEALWRVANRDALTGEGNRTSFTDAIARLEAGGQVLLIDLDKFKFVNDTLGHHVGDALLKAFACRVVPRLGAQDALFRLGGDEFVILLRGADAHAATEMARRVVDCLTEPFDICGTRVAIGGSIGVAAIDEKADSPTEVLERADLALYRAKQTFGNEFRHYEPSMSAAARDRMRLEQEIRRGVLAGEFYLEYQPIVNVERGQVRGFEALVRWRHPTLGEVPPCEFVPIAEVSGLIVALGDFVLRRACAEAAQWPAPLSVAVNVSVEQFKQRTFCDQVLAALDASGLPPGRLVLEMTETVFSVDLDMVSLTFDRLKKLGVRFALDDFGTGYSSINRLRQLDMDYIKLDRSFAASIVSDPREESVVASIIEIGETFGLSATAEGIETIEQLDMMRAKGVTDAQGFLFARPLPAGEVAAFLAKDDAAPAHDWPFARRGA
jgi:diguanylate cyclase (GGDEF)-like protein